MQAALPPLTVYIVIGYCIKASLHVQVVYMITKQGNCHTCEHFTVIIMDAIRLLIELLFT